MDDELIKAFKRIGYELDTSDLVSKCASLAARLSLTAKEIGLEFEAFAITR